MKRHAFQKQSEEDLFQFEIQQFVHLIQHNTPLLWNVLKIMALSNAQMHEVMKKKSHEMLSLYCNY